MKNIQSAKWIKYPYPHDSKAVDFLKTFSTQKEVRKATLEISALGVYEVRINGEIVGDQVLAPGWTSYNNRVQVETHDVTDLIKKQNYILISVAPGWKANVHYGHIYPSKFLAGCDTAAICALEIEYEDGEVQIISSGNGWGSRKSKTRYSDFYNGYVYDPAYVDGHPVPAVAIPHPTDILIDRCGEKIKEQERLAAKELIITPKGETVIDFGQNMTGYVEFKIKGKKGEKVTVYHAEVLDAQGNFYTDNLRSAKAQAVFICDGKEHIYKPSFNFFGFRYIKLENFSDEIKLENFTAIVVHSDMKRTGYFECSDKRVNQLFSNVIWGQKGNFLDIPTDCPQRDERLGWTGDAEVFIKAASYNFDVEKFFLKWLGDLRIDQRRWGTVPAVIPDVFAPDEDCSAAWADAVSICPWQLYLTYGNKEILKESIHSIKEYIEYIKRNIRDGMWADSWHFGDWLNLDASTDKDCSLGTDKNLIATAYFTKTLEILIKILKMNGEDYAEYETLRNNAIDGFRRNFMKNGEIIPEKATQTACVLAVHFGISDDIAKTAAQLNSLVKECGHLKTGFVGTPYLLHALSDNGYAETAYDLLLREEYPSWLFSVKMGATTVWEHWDSLREDGTMWSTSMNSFNHYAYGAVADWMYENAAGIKLDETSPAFEKIIFKPLVDSRLDYVKASIDTRSGVVAAEWRRNGDKIDYIFTVPENSTAVAVIDGKEIPLSAGENRI